MLSRCDSTVISSVDSYHQLTRGQRIAGTPLQVKPEYAQIEHAQIMESGLENSFAREHYSTAIEKGINEQINTVRAGAPLLCSAAANQLL